MAQALIHHDLFLDWECLKIKRGATHCLRKEVMASSDGSEGNLKGPSSGAILLPPIRYDSNILVSATAPLLLADREARTCSGNGFLCIRPTIIKLPKFYTNT